MPRKGLLRHVKNIVVKVGSSSITEKGKLSEKKISRFVADSAALIQSGYKVTIVSSGAIAAGAAKLGKDKRMLTIPEKQALASLGQTLLMNEYRKQFLKVGHEVGQILLTEDDVKNRHRFLNARHTLQTLFGFGIVPIVNENDSVVVKEIKFGDNDTLSAHVASIIDADLLVILSDIDGFYWDLGDKKPLEEIHEISNEIIERAGGSGSVYGTGGMMTKIYAAQIIMNCGEMMMIVNSAEENVLTRIMSGEKLGTLFVSPRKSVSGKKKWIALLKNKGNIEIDEGALEALVKRKKSLLATGITRVEGNFAMGDSVAIIDQNHRVIGKGIVNYSWKEIGKIKGKKTNEIQEILSSSFFDEVINRDDMIIY